MTTVRTIKSSNAEKLSKTEWFMSLNYAQRQRLRYFEARLLWEGHVNRQEVCDQFGVTANHFTRDVRLYKAHFPENISYDVSKRTYKPTHKFNPKIANGQPEEYLALLRGYANHPSTSILAEIGSFVPTSVMEEPQGVIDQKLLRIILFGIHHRLGVRINYQSFSHGEVSERTVWPHALAWAGFRWHVRAYDQIRGGYIDLVLTRILNANAGKEEIPSDAGRDNDWYETEEIEIIPAPHLSATQQQAVANEYGMKKTSTGYQWSVTIRRCLVPYFLYYYRLDEEPKQNQTNTFHRRVILKNAAEICKHTFPED